MRWTQIPVRNILENLDKQLIDLFRLAFALELFFQQIQI